MGGGLGGLGTPWGGVALDLRDGGHAGAGAFAQIGSGDWFRPCPKGEGGGRGG